MSLSSAAPITLHIDPARLAAVAPDHDDDETRATRSVSDDHLDELCEAWLWWCRTRRGYVPSLGIGTNILGKLRGKSRPPVDRDWPVRAELMAFHLAYCGQPDTLAKRVFDLYYVYRVKPVKQAADALGISRKHFYSLLSDFRRSVALSASRMSNSFECVESLD